MVQAHVQDDQSWDGAVGDENHDESLVRAIAGRELAVVLLAELAAILARHPDRVPALLGEAGIVDDPGLDGPSTLEGGQDQVAHLGEHGRIRPRRLTNEMQERLVLGGNPGRGRDRSYRLDALARGRHKQTRAVVAQGCGAVGVADDVDQRRNIGGKPHFTAVMGSHRRALRAGQGPPSIPPDRPPNISLCDAVKLKFSRKSSAPEGTVINRWPASGARTMAARLGPPSGS